MKPNRVVAIAGAVISLALAVLPVVLNFDWTSTAGCIAGIIAILGIVQSWLKGWQEHEARLYEADPLTYVERNDPSLLPVPRIADQGDVGRA